MGELILDEVMAPGDVLYVPSRLAHYGVAQDDCLTVSFGLRYPNTSELLESIRNHLYHPSLEVNELAIPFRLSPSEQKTGELTPQDVQQMKALFLQQLANSAQFDTLFQQALATTVSRRRYELLEVAGFSDPEDVLESFEHGGRLRQDNNCKLVYTQDPFRIYANGEWLDELTYAEAEILKQLADGQTVDFAFLTRLIGSLQDQQISMEVLVDSICNWLDDGWALLTE